MASTDSFAIGFKNIHMARTAIVSLILGSPPAKVYGNLRTVASRLKERF
jgi:RNA-binding protein PNO1